MGFKSTEWKEIEGVKWFRFNSKWDHFRYWWSNLLTTILIILLITMMFYAYRHVEAVLHDPFIFGAQKRYESSGEHLMCTCVQNNEDLKTFYFNDTALWAKDQPPKNLSFSNLLNTSG